MSRSSNPRSAAAEPDRHPVTGPFRGVGEPPVVLQQQAAQYRQRVAAHEREGHGLDCPDWNSHRVKGLHRNSGERPAEPGQHGRVGRAAPGHQQAIQAFNAAERENLTVVRRYREKPSPLVRDGIRNWRTGLLERVLEGNFDLFE